ncbi:hypothetical protein HK405_001242, partial [Cladochytrium tenue]
MAKTHKHKGEKHHKKGSHSPRQTKEDKASESSPPQPSEASQLVAEADDAQLPQVHTADPGRALDQNLAAADAAEIYAARDWNEDLQTSRELPRATAQDRVIREQAIFRNHADFVDAAARGVMGIISKSISPLNPQEPNEESQMFVHGGIFYSYGPDLRDGYEGLGGAPAVHTAVGKDVRGVSLLNSLDIEGLFTIGTAVVDYKGKRIVAQGIIPGILKRQQADPSAGVVPIDEVSNSSPEVVPVSEENGAAGEESPGELQVVVPPVASENVVAYGSIDGGKTIAADPTFHRFAGVIAQRLHLDEHEVLDGSGKHYSLYTSLDTKGIVGDDKRRYFLDLARVFPVDIEFIEENCSTTTGDATDDATPRYPHQMTLLRAELVDTYFEHRLRKYVEEKRSKSENESGEKPNGEDEEKEQMPKEESSSAEDQADVADAFVLKPSGPDVAGEDSESDKAKLQKDNTDYTGNPPSFSASSISDQAGIKFNMNEDGQAELGTELMTEAATIYEQVYGPVHPDTARTYRNLAMMKHDSGDSEACRVYQRKAVIASERTLGVDSSETVQQYMHLGFFEWAAGNVEVGLRYMFHSLRRLEMLCAGSLHPELAAFDTQLGMLLTQSRADVVLATKFHSRAVTTNEKLLGRDNDQTIRSYDLLCQSLIYAGDFRGALDAQRIVYKFLKARSADPNSAALKDASATLDFLAQQAVLE